MRQITATGQVSVTGAATLIRQKNVPTAGAIVRNSSATDNVYLGNSDVTVAIGHILGPKESITVPIQTGIYGIVSGSAVLVSFIEIQ